ncbi:MAG: hypothetical protein QGI52_08150, partial [Alphaproteobacteria bacterium]|nr:hypothetical protein [Alphaproteobacteria bacterium]
EERVSKFTPAPRSSAARAVLAEAKTSISRSLSAMIHDLRRFPLTTRFKSFYFGWQIHQVRAGFLHTW